MLILTKEFTYLNPDSDIIFIYAFVVQRMVDFDISPNFSIVKPLLKIKGVILVGLGRGASHNAIEYHRVSFNARAKFPGMKIF